MAFHILFATTVLCLTALCLSVEAYLYCPSFYAPPLNRPGFYIQAPQQESVKHFPLDEPCLGCLCEANGECMTHMKCSGEVCGMFGITWAYWSDSGKPVVKGSNPRDGNAYHECANDPVCAKASVVGYMKRFAQDCNNDGVIDCYDYAAIHKLGGFGCRGHLPHEYKKRFMSCQNSIQHLSG